MKNHIYYEFELNACCSGSNAYLWIINWDNHKTLYPQNKDIKILDKPKTTHLGTKLEIHSEFLFKKNVETYVVTDVGFKEYGSLGKLVIEKQSIGGDYHCWDRIVIYDTLYGCKLKFEMYAEIPKGIMTILKPILKWWVLKIVKKSWKKAISKIEKLEDEGKV